MVLTHDRPSSGLDVSLVRRACAGDYEAFTALMERHADPVRRLVRRFVRDGDDARDVEQDTWIRAANNLESLADGNRFEPWVKAIARNTSLNYLSSRKRLGAHVTTFEVLGTEEFEDEGSPTPEAAVLSKDSQQKVWQALGALSDRDRTALFLREYKGLPYSEIADELGVSRNAAEVCAHRARERFRLAFTNVDADIPECGVDGLRLSTLLEPAASAPLAARIELEAHLGSCDDCQRRLAAMADGRTLYRNLGGFSLPIPGAGLFGWAGDLLAKLGHLLGITGGGGASTAAAAGASATAATTAGMAVVGTAGTAAVAGSTLTGIGSAVVATAIASTAAAAIVVGAVVPALGVQPGAAGTASAAAPVGTSPFAIPSTSINASLLPGHGVPPHARNAGVADELDPAMALVAPVEEFATALPGDEGVDAVPPQTGGRDGPSVPVAPMSAVIVPTSVPAGTPDQPAPTPPPPAPNSVPAAEADTPAVAPPASVPAPTPRAVSLPPAATTAENEQKSPTSARSSPAEPGLDAGARATPVRSNVLIEATIGPPGRGPDGAGPAGKGPHGDGPPGVGPLAAGAAAAVAIVAERSSAASAGVPSDTGAVRSTGGDGPPVLAATGGTPRGHGAAVAGTRGNGPGEK